MTSISLVGGVSGFRGGGALESAFGCCAYGPVKLGAIHRCPRNGGENGKWRGRDQRRPPKNCALAGAVSAEPSTTIPSTRARSRQTFLLLDFATKLSKLCRHHPLGLTAIPVFALLRPLGSPIRAWIERRCRQSPEFHQTPTRPVNVPFPSTAQRAAAEAAIHVAPASMAAWCDCPGKKLRSMTAKTSVLSPQTCCRDGLVLFGPLWRRVSLQFPGRLHRQLLEPGRQASVFLIVAAIAAIAGAVNGPLRGALREQGPSTRLAGNIKNSRVPVFAVNAARDQASPRRGWANRYWPLQRRRCRRENPARCHAGQ
jgi:hypothetical protein